MIFKVKYKTYIKNTANRFYVMCDIKFSPKDMTRSYMTTRKQITWFDLIFHPVELGVTLKQFITEKRIELECDNMIIIIKNMILNHLASQKYTSNRKEVKQMLANLCTNNWQDIEIEIEK